MGRGTVAPAEPRGGRAAGIGQPIDEGPGQVGRVRAGGVLDLLPQGDPVQPQALEGAA